MGPGTTIANKMKQAIYGIWGSQGIIISQVGYFPYHFGPKSDQRLLWIKTPHLVAFGEKKPPLRSPEARRLILHYPRGQGNGEKTPTERCGDGSRMWGNEVQYEGGEGEERV